jgi:hypothetical protein
MFYVVFEYMNYHIGHFGRGFLSPV